MRNFTAAILLAFVALGCGHARADFVEGSTSLPAAKTDRTPRPNGVLVTQWFGAGDFNLLRSSLIDLRSWALAGKLHGLTCQSSVPSVSGATHFLWCDSLASSITNTDWLRWYDGTSSHYLVLAPGFTSTGTGTVTVTNASTTVTGSSTAFAASDVGRGIKLPDGKTYVIASRTSATQIALHKAYGGSTLSGQAYTLLDMDVASSAQANWQTPIIENTWAAGFAAPMFRKDSRGMVYIRGAVAGGTVGTNPTDRIFTLPEGYRPGQSLMFFVVESNGAHALAMINSTTGEVHPYSGSTVEFIFDGISFLAEN